MERIMTGSQADSCAGRSRMWSFVAACVAAGLAFVTAAHAQEPIKIGFSVSLTGGLASSGKAHLLSKQIWVEEINAQGGLLGRPVQLVYYDDQTNASLVPGLCQAHGHRQSRPFDECGDKPDRRSDAAD